MFYNVSTSIDRRIDIHVYMHISDSNPIARMSQRKLQSTIRLKKENGGQLENFLSPVIYTHFGE